MKQTFIATWESQLAAPTLTVLYTIKTTRTCNTCFRTNRTFALYVSVKTSSFQCNKRHAYCHMFLDLVFHTYRELFLHFTANNNEMSWLRGDYRWRLHAGNRKHKERANSKKREGEDIKPSCDKASSPLKMGPIRCPETSVEISTQRRLISQKSADIANNAAEVWNVEYVGSIGCK
jgi:hypothetical protein